MRQFILQKEEGGWGRQTNALKPVVFGHSALAMRGNAGQCTYIEHGGISAELHQVLAQLALVLIQNICQADTTA